MSRARLAIHAHFYQPAREDPWSGRVRADETAAPFHDWNERIDSECYRPNAERGNLDHISWNLGPTLARWLAVNDPLTHARFVSTSQAAMAQPFNHAILPLASAADRRTEIAWGIRDFEVRFGHRPRGLWLPETAVDLATLREAVDQGIEFTILAPWQAANPDLETRQPYRVDLGAGRSIVVVFYDQVLSSAVSFDPDATTEADRFVRERVLPRLAGAITGKTPLVEPPLALIASDGELYGHHQPFRDLFLERLLAVTNGDTDPGFEFVNLADAVLGGPEGAHPAASIVERTSWSCHHGVARWSAECPDAPDGRWKGPLRAALERLAGAIDVVTALELGTLATGRGAAGAGAARDSYVDVILGVTDAATFATGRWPAAMPAARERGLAMLEASRWRLAMFASDAWYWDDPVRPETRQVLRAAARAARIVDELVGTGLEATLVSDLGILTSPSTGLDGAAIYRQALAEVGR